MNISDVVEDKLIDLGFNPGMTGFYCMKEAILYFINNNKEFYQVKLGKELYKSISEKTSSSAACVERNIRSLVENARMNNPELFGSISDYMTGNVTNSSAIAYLLMLVRRELQNN